MSYVSLETCLQRPDQSAAKFQKCLVDYNVNESQTKKNLSSFVALERQASRWQEDSFGSVKIKKDMQLATESGLATFDQMQASNQKLKLQANSRVTGNVSLDK